MKECRSGKNLEACNCSYEPCSRKGVCCECLQYHSVERTYDRSLRRFMAVMKDKT
jgi:hypothetical protein